MTGFPATKFYREVHCEEQDLRWAHLLGHRRVELKLFRSDSARAFDRSKPNFVGRILWSAATCTAQQLHSCPRLVMLAE